MSDSHLCTRVIENGDCNKILQSQGIGLIVLLFGFCLPCSKSTVKSVDSVSRTAVPQLSAMLKSRHCTRGERGNVRVVMRKEKWDFCSLSTNHSQWPPELKPWEKLSIFCPLQWFLVQLLLNWADRQALCKSQPLCLRETTSSISHFQFPSHSALDCCLPRGVFPSLLPSGARCWGMI